MQLVLMSEGLQPYLEESMWIDYQHPLIQEKIHQIKQMASTKLERAELAFNFVRDEITHSFDIDSTKVTASASEAIEQREGICFAKAHLLAALLRGMGIPTGFCYQRVTRKGTVESGYALHGLNAVYFDELQKWFRVDPRGNKPGCIRSLVFIQKNLRIRFEQRWMKSTSHMYIVNRWQMSLLRYKLLPIVKSCFSIVQK